MRRFAFFCLNLTVLFSATFCASLPPECETARLSQLGYASAKAGRPRQSELTGQCGRNASIDYEIGYDKGKSEFCSPEATASAAFSLGSRGATEEATSADHFNICEFRQDLFAVYQKNYMQGLQQFCSLERAASTGQHVGSLGGVADFALAPYARCGNERTTQLQAAYLKGYEAGLEKFCSPQRFGEVGYNQGLRGAPPTADTKMENCPVDGRPILASSYDRRYRQGLAVFCQPASLRQVAIRESQTNPEPKFPESLKVCQLEFPDVEAKYLALFRAERGNFVKNHCHREAGRSQGLDDAKNLVEKREKIVPAFCDEESFAHYQEGYLDGWKGEKDRLCNISGAYDRGIKDAQGAKAMKVEIPDVCPPDYQATIIKKYREGYLYYRNQITGQPTEAD